MPGHPVGVESTEPGCCYNADSASPLLTSTNSFHVIGKSPQETNEGFIVNNVKGLTINEKV